MRHATLLLALAFSTALSAQRPTVERLSLEVRGDYTREDIDGHKNRATSGIHGKYFNLCLDGSLTKQFTYSYRQRLNRSSTDASFFDATDWLFLDYHPDDHWTFSAGKVVAAIGGYEYDAPPIDLYFCSEFWNNIPCYQWGASVSRRFSANDMLRAQVCQSPFRSHFKAGGTHTVDTYGYNLIWYGTHGPWSTMWSANMMELQEGRFISYLALGNKLRLGKQVSLQLDYMNRAAAHQTYFFRDCMVMGQLSYRPSEKFNLFAKACYDVNNTDNAEDLCVMAGTELTRFGGGVEYYPLGNRDLRLHAVYSYTTGTNANPAGALHDRQSTANVGLTWRLNIIQNSKF